MVKASPPGIPRISRRFIYISTIFLSSRILVVLIGMIAFSIFPQRGEVFHKHAISEVVNMQSIWNKFDCTWYGLLALDGYPHRPFDPNHQSTWGFMPLYSILMRAVSLIVGKHYFWIGVTLSNLCTFVALFIIYKLVSEISQCEKKVMILLMLAGGAFYFSIVYTEGLFLLVTALVFLNAHRRNYALALLFAGLGAVTRVHGFLLYVVPVFEILKYHRLRSARYAPALAASLIPIGVFMTYLQSTCGDALAFLKVQRAWGSTSTYPFQGLRVLFSRSVPLGSWVNASFWVITIAFLIIQRKKIPVSYLIFGLLFPLISTSNEFIYGTTRYTLPLIPLYLAVSESNEVAYESYLVFNVAFLALNISAFVTGTGTFI